MQCMLRYSGSAVAKKRAKRTPAMANFEVSKAMLSRKMACSGTPTGMQQRVCIFKSTLKYNIMEKDRLGVYMVYRQVSSF